MNKNILHLYHYIDENGLDSLYAQCGQFLVEQLTTMERSGKIDGGAKIELPKLLSLIGIGEAKMEGTISLNNLKSKSFKTILRIEQRIPLILDYLKANKELFEINESNSQISIEKGFVLVESKFQTPNFKEILKKSNPSKDELNLAALTGRGLSFGFVKFKTITTLYNITMGTSLNKYITGLHHLMLMWKQFKDDRKQVDLCVFGYLTKTDENTFYLKPFSISEIK